MVTRRSKGPSGRVKIAEEESLLFQAAECKERIWESTWIEPQDKDLKNSVMRESVGKEAQKNTQLHD